MFLDSACFADVNRITGVWRDTPPVPCMNDWRRLMILVSLCEWLNLSVLTAASIFYEIDEVHLSEIGAVGT